MLNTRAITKAECGRKACQIEGVAHGDGCCNGAFLALLAQVSHHDIGCTNMSVSEASNDQDFARKILI